MKEKWAVILWEYGRHHDEFNVIEVDGPFTFNKALDIETSVEATGNYHVTIAPMKGD